MSITVLHRWEVISIVVYKDKKVKYINLMNWNKISKKGVTKDKKQGQLEY